VTDNNGIIVARSERQEDFVGKPLPPDLLAQSRAQTGVYRATNVTGDRIIRATTRSELAGWLVSATVPESYLDEPLRRSFMFTALLLGIALMLGGPLAYLFARLMTRPLYKATLLAGAMGRGEDIAPLNTNLVEANVLIETLSDAAAELKRREEFSTFLTRELAHRAKNQLAVVQGMAMQTARQAGSLDTFVEQFGRRLQGLAQSQDVLVKQNWKGAWMSDLVRAHLEMFAAGDRAEISGPDLFLDTAAVQNIGFALHELATNASKHGALSSPAGRVLVKWSIVEGEAFTIEWIEKGGPPASMPGHKGFGYRVITELVPQSLEGTSDVEFAASGLRWRLTVPWAHAQKAFRE
jgi:two-component sensor histidine kinase